MYIYACLCILRSCNYHFNIISLFIDGALKELDDDTIHCGSRAVNQFLFDAGDKRMKYKCATGEGGSLEGGHLEYTAWTKGADKGTNYLDKHFFECPTHEFLTFFDEQVKGDEIRFQYECKKWFPTRD